MLVMSELGGRGLDIATEDPDTLNDRLVIRSEPAPGSVEIDSFKNRPGNLVYELYAELQSRGYKTEFVLPGMEKGETDDYAVDAFALDPGQASMIKEVIDRAVVSKPAEAYEDIESGNVLRWYHIVNSPRYRDKKARELSLETEEAARFLPRIYMSAYNTANELRSMAFQLESSSGHAFSASKRFFEGRWLSYGRVYEQLSKEKFKPLSVEEKQGFITAAINQALQETEMPITGEDDESAD